MRVKIIIEDIFALEIALNKFIENELAPNEYIDRVCQNALPYSLAADMLVTLWIKEIEVAGNVPKTQIP